ncbi:PilZ domain-containing protein [bacterium]|nr:PilZ domain-containing protein [bacterium]
MKELINSIKDFKIIPYNHKSSVSFELIDVDDNIIKIRLIPDEDFNLDDYTPSSNVEVFGVNDVGLVYFETKILSKNDVVLELATTQDFSIIQRREYSRVGMKQGTILFKDLGEDFILNVEDISAGGMKFIAKSELELDREYALEIDLPNNMIINCSLKPIRIRTTRYENKDAYVVSGKFVNLENVDRIVLVQYAFKIKMEEQNKENS